MDKKLYTIPCPHCQEMIELSPEDGAKAMSAVRPGIGTEEARRRGRAGALKRWGKVRDSHGL